MTTKFYQNPDQSVVDQALAATTALSSHQNLLHLEAQEGVRVILRRDWDPQEGEVALISGGGSGHEPAHAGFVGQGMLTAAVCGQVFASPSIGAILAAIVAVTGDAGTLLLVKNYTGDRLNFGVAAELAKARGYKVEMVIIDDDVAIHDSLHPRGIAGTVLVHKVAGHVAREGGTLEEVKEAARKTVERLASIGASMTTCRTPSGNDATEDRIPPGKLELGLGIHGESGVSLIDYHATKPLVNDMFEALLKGLDQKQDGVNDGRFALLINNLGGVSPLEMAAISDDILSHDLMSRIDLIVGPGRFVTSLDMKGFSLSLLLLDEPLEDAILSYVEADGWKQALPQEEILEDKIFTSQEVKELEQERGKETFSPLEEVNSLIRKLLDCLIEGEERFNELDRFVGDADTGTTFATGAKAIKNLLEKEALNQHDAPQLLQQIGDALTLHMGGSSGALLAILATRASTSLKKMDSGAMPSLPTLGAALLEGVETMMAYGGATLGSRTMLDALHPACVAMQEGRTLQEVAAAARAGADSTVNMKAAVGRSSYVNDDRVMGHIDPGAEVIASLFEALTS